MFRLIEEVWPWAMLLVAVMCLPGGGALWLSEGLPPCMTNTFIVISCGGTGVSIQHRSFYLQRLIASTFLPWGLSLSSYEDSDEHPVSYIAPDKDINSSEMF